MSAWWEHGYPGGPMVKCPPLPRPLYPPDANRHGKTPSRDGPDVIAYKRCAWRAGRWPGPASAFDDSFSNGFAHGRGPNVIDTGIAGIQRQQHVDATGWVGTKTYNTLRSIRIPEPLPHAGEPAMDAYAVQLIEEAWELFGGSEPAPAAGGVRAEALQLAIGELGTTESPPGSNLNPYGDWYGMDGVPWCAIFCSWAYEHAGGSPSFIPGVSYSYVPYIVGDARANRNGLETTDDPIPGDLVCYDWEGNGEYDHVGLFERWIDGITGFHAVEGNTAIGNDSNGGEVMRRERYRSAQSTVFVRVAQ